MIASLIDGSRHALGWARQQSRHLVAPVCAVNTCLMPPEHVTHLAIADARARPAGDEMRR